MRLTTLLSPVLLLAVPVGSINAADDETLKDATLTWLKNNVTEKNKDNSIVAAMSKPVAEFTKGGHNFTIMMGSDLNRSGKPVMICGWAGELFPFTLSEAQARVVSLRSTGLTANANRRYGKPVEKPAAMLSEFKIPDADSLDGGKPIKGTVKVKVVKTLKDAENLRFRLDLKFPEFTQIKFFTPKAMPEDGGVVAFTFSEINSPGAKGKPYRGPVGVFLNIVEGPKDDEKKLGLLSNTLGVLIDVE